MSGEIQIEAGVERALLSSTEVKANIAWLGFQINPGIPDEDSRTPTIARRSSAPLSAEDRSMRPSPSIAAALLAEIAAANGVSGWPGQPNATSVAEKAEGSLTFAGTTARQA